MLFVIDAVQVMINRSPLYYTIFIIIFLNCNLSYCEEIPRIKSPVVYVGAFQDTIAHSIVLYLNEFQEFVLQEEVTMQNGKTSSWQTTGTWYQIRDGAFIQLTNRNGYERFVNVGGNADLYFSIQSFQREHITVPIYAEDIDPPPYQLQGDLYISKQNIFLKNYENNISYRISPETIVKKFIESYGDNLQQPISVHADVEVAKNTGKASVLRIKNIQSINTQNSLKTKELLPVLLDTITGYRWEMIYCSLGDRIPFGAYFFFLPDGSFDVFDGVTHETGQYVLNGKKISLTASVKSPLFRVLLEQAHTLNIVGEVLEIWGEHRVLAVLEKKS